MKLSTEGSDFMKITTQGNGIRIGTRLEEKIASKMSKFDKYSVMKEHSMSASDLKDPIW